MNQESNVNREKASPEPEKLMDRPSDFRFHAAYLVYSDAWDKAPPENKQKINEILAALSADKIGYETFYREISQYRVDFNVEHFRSARALGGRTFIETERKKDWRKREERESRNKRHGR